MTTATIDLSNEKGLRRMHVRARRHVIPPPKLAPSEWAEAHCRIPNGNALPGPVRFRNAPYQREPLDMIDNPDVHTISLMWGAQTGKTQVQLMSIGYFISHKPQKQIVMQPSETDLLAWLTDKFEPLAESTPDIKNKMAPPRGRDGVNNKKMKQYIGGSLQFSWAGSPNTMRGRSAPKIYCDEVDGYDRTKEGSQISLISERNSTFLDDRMLFITSTPTDKNFSVIDDFYNQGDGRQWWVPCRDCGHHQVLRWEQVHWITTDDGDHKPDTAGYCCESCGSLWDDGKRFWSTRNGEWRSQRIFAGHASYHLPSMASTLVRLADIVREFLRRKESNDLQTFVNTKLAEAWEERGERVDTHSLMACAEPFPDTIPDGVHVLTIGADVQADRIECELVGWDASEQSWSIAYEILPGDPTQDDVWQQLEDVIRARYPHESGSEMSVSQVCVDAGYLTKRVQAFCGRMGTHVVPVFGRAGPNRPVVETSLQRVRRLRKRRQSGVRTEIVGVDEAKSVIYRRLRLSPGQPGSAHFPDDRDEEWFHQLTSEKLVTRYSKGRPVREWLKTRERNEALDCRVYAYAALLLYGVERVKKRESKGVPRSVVHKPQPSGYIR